MNEKTMKGLRPGSKYHIRMEDCCIKASLTGIFKFINSDDEAVFDIGTIGPDWGAWFIEEQERE